MPFLLGHISSVLLHHPAGGERDHCDVLGVDVGGGHAPVLRSSGCSINLAALGAREHSREESVQRDTPESRFSCHVGLVMADPLYIDERPERGTRCFLGPTAATKALQRRSVVVLAQCLVAVRLPGAQVGLAGT